MDFRVTAGTLKGVQLVEEFFPTAKEADAFIDGLMQDGGVLDGLGEVVTVASWEMCNGVWTVLSRKLVRC